MAIRWDRTDQFGTEGLLGLGALLAVGVGIGGPLLVLVRGGDVTTPVELDPSRVSGVPDLTGPVQASVLLRDAGLGERLLAVLPTVLGAVLAATVLLLLLAVLRSARSGEPFAAPNVRRLQAVAVLIALGGTVVAVVQSVCRAELASRAALPDQGVALELSLLPLAAGLLVAFFAELLRRGAVLRRDVEGLV